MAIRKSATSSGESLKIGWLDALKNASGNQVIKFDTEAGDQIVQVGKAQIPIKIFEYGPESAGLPGMEAKEEEYLPLLPGISKDYPVARISPSNLPQAADSDGETWKIMQGFNFRISIKGKPEMDVLGNAIHAYLAADSTNHTDTEQLTMAQNIVKSWGMEDAVDPAEVVAAGQRLTEFVEKNYPGHKAYKEWPMMIRNGEGQVIQGWIDLLLETKDGYVIIDHKDYPGQNVEERARKYTSQLRAYKEAVEKSTGRPVIDVLLHLPVSGLILRLV